MKFSLFVHMERLDASQDHKTLYEEFVTLCEIADRGGMHAIWTGEHHGMDFTIAPNPFVTIADLARRTKTARLGTGTVIAPFWHPIKLACRRQAETAGSRPRAHGRSHYRSAERHGPRHACLYCRWRSDGAG